MKPFQTLLSTAVLLAALRTSGGAVDDKMAGGLPAQVLTDANYEGVMKQTEGLALVWFHTSGTQVDEAALLREASWVTNRIKFFRINRTENPVIWERILSGAISPPIYINGRGFANGRRVIRTPVLSIMSFNGVEFGDFESELDMPPAMIEETLCRWVDDSARSINRRQEGKTNNISTTFADDQIVPFFEVALVQMKRPWIPRDGYSNPYPRVWDCLNGHSPADALAPLVPYITPHLGGEYTLEACRVLERIGDQAAPSVDALMALIEEVTREVDAKPKVDGSEWEQRVVALRKATAAAYALGGIGPKAAQAVLLLTRISESEYGRMSSGRSSDTVGESKYGWDGSLGLQCAISLNRIQPPPAVGKDAGVAEGKTLRVWSQGPSPEGVKGTTVVFWNGRHCYVTTAGADGSYSIKLPPGRYLMQHGNGLPGAERDFSMQMQAPEIVQVAAAKVAKQDVATERIFVDYGHGAAYEVMWKGQTNTVTQLMDEAAALVRNAAATAGQRLSKPRGVAESAASIDWECDGLFSVRLVRAKQGKLLLTLQAFGPKRAADKAVELDQAVVRTFATNQNLQLKDLPDSLTRRDWQNRLDQHKVQYSIQTVQVGLDSTNVPARIAEIIQPFIAGSGFKPDRNKDLRWSAGAGNGRCELVIRTNMRGWTELLLDADGYENSALAEHIDEQIKTALSQEKSVWFERSIQRNLWYQ